MGTKLDKILSEIDPARTIDETYARTDWALNSFPIRRAQITDWNQFQQSIAELVHHIQQTVLRLRHPMEINPAMEWSQGLKCLRKEYGANGEKTAFQIARTGNEGGLYAVLKAVARQMAEEYSGNEIRARIGDFWSRLTVDEKLQAADEYLHKFGHLLPPEVTEGYAGWLKGNFDKFLAEHPKLIRSLRHACR